MQGEHSVPAVRFGHEPVIRPRTIVNCPRLPDALVERFRTAYLPDISDAVGQLYTMSPAIRPLYTPIKRLVGLALTVKALPGDNMAIHGALEMAQPGDVLVVDWRGHIDGCGTGAQSLIVPMRRGLRGVVVDGGWRDVAELRAMDFPVFGKAVSAFSPPKMRPGEINVPVCCGGVIVEPVDMVIADEEGIVVVPRTYAQIVADSLATAPSFSERPVDDLEARAKRRAAFFANAFEAAGGVELEWSDIHRSDK